MGSMSTIYYIGMALAVIFASARITRNIVFDDFPPTAALRAWWDTKTAGNGWNSLLHCGYCAGFWIALPFTVLGAGLTFGWAIFGTLVGLFWVICAWFAVGYLSGVIVASDWG